MKSKEFDKWNEKKKLIEKEEKYPYFKQREIFNMKLGDNIGFEECGKGENFVRPVLILKILRKEMFFGIPLSTSSKEGSFFFPFEFITGIKSNALLAQMRLFSSKRLLNKTGIMDKKEFDILKEKLKTLIF